MDRTVFVDCMLDDNVIRTYDFLCPASLGAPPVLPPNDHFIQQAKSNLSTEGLAMPPYAAIKFVVRVR